MYLIGVLVFILLLGAVSVFTGSTVALIDFPSLVVVLGFSLPLMMGSGLLPDFVKGFRLAGQKVNPYSVVELKRIHRANRLAMAVFPLSGGMGTLIGFVSILANVSGIEAMIPAFGVATLTFFYSLVPLLLVLPVDAHVQAVLDTLE